MQDTNLMLRDASDGNLDANELTPTAVDFGAGDRQAMTYKVVVPQADGSSPTLDIVIAEADTEGGTYRDVLTFPQITEAGVYRVSGRLDGRWRRHESTVGGSSPDFGAVEIGPEPQGEHTAF